MRTLAALGAMLLAGSVFAGTLRGNDENCMHLAYQFDNIAGYRDEGVPWIEAKAAIVQAIADSMQHPQGLVRDEEDALLVMDLADRLWNKDLATSPPGVVGVRVYDLCMGAKKKVML